MSLFSQQCNNLYYLNFSIRDRLESWVYGLKFQLKRHQLLYTDTLLTPSDAPLAYLGWAILLDGQKSWLRRQNHWQFLPSTSSLAWCKRAKFALERARCASEYGIYLILNFTDPMIVPFVPHSSFYSQNVILWKKNLEITRILTLSWRLFNLQSRLFCSSQFNCVFQ